MMGGRGGSSGTSGQASTAGYEITASNMNQIKKEFMLSNTDRRVQIAEAVQSSIGRQVANNADAIGAEVGLVNTRHVGNYQFEGTVAGQRVIVQTTPTGGKNSRVSITDIRVPL